MHRLEKVRMSIRAQNQLGQIKSKTGIPINVLARFGIVMSMRDQNIPNPDMYAEDGMELLPHILYGKNEAVYAALIQYLMREYKLEYDQYADRMMRAHLNRGAGMLFTRIDTMEDFGDLLRSAA